MEYERTYSLVDIAGKLGKSRSTVKEWAMIFQEFFPTVGQGRSMRYREEALEIFNLISTLRDEKQPNDHIRNILRGIVKEITVVADDGDTPFLKQIVEGYSLVYQEIQELRETNEELIKRLEMYEEREKEREKKDIEREDIIKEIHKSVSEVSVSLSRMETYKKKTWFSRIFG